MKHAKTFDSKCFDLAAAFLEDEPSLNTEERRNALAADIQDAIEAYIDYERRTAAMLAERSK